MLQIEVLCSVSTHHKLFKIYPSISQFINFQLGKQTLSSQFIQFLFCSRYMAISIQKQFHLFPSDKTIRNKILLQQYHTCSRYKSTKQKLQ